MEIRTTAGASIHCNGLHVLLTFIALVVGAARAAMADEMNANVDDSAIKCMLKMTKVRRFYVDNVLGDLQSTVAVAQAGRGEYPPGSVVQLIPKG